MICLPAGRSFTGPFPPGFFAARTLAAVILPPLLFFAILNTSFNFAVSLLSRSLLLPYDLLDLTDLFLNLAAYLFIFSFGFQPGIQTEFSGDLLDHTFYFVEYAFRLVLRAGFHGIPPVEYCFLRCHTDQPWVNRCPWNALIFSFWGTNKKVPGEQVSGNSRYLKFFAS